MSGVLQEIQQMIALDSEHCVFIESSNALLFFLPQTVQEYDTPAYPICGTAQHNATYVIGLKV